MLPGVENLSGIRTFRVLRALRTISAVKGKETHTLHEVILPRELCSTEIPKKKSLARGSPSEWLA